VKIYTKGGDDGTTGLLHGGRVSKSDPATDAYGTVDEAVSALGLARAFLSESAGRDSLAAETLRVQQELFIVGADLATNPEQRGKLKAGTSLVTPDMTERLETLIDGFVSANPLPNEFIVPGANPASAAFDVARTVVRRAERRSVDMRDSGREVNPEVLRYLNRLADLLFVLAREAADAPEPRSRPSL
jgi:cob(I)alamin adenosyltransferase